MNGSISFLRPTPAVEKTPADLEGKLVWLTRFGKPRVCCNGKGFSAHIEMHVAQQGATFDIRSEFGMNTPTAAIDMLISRTLESLAKLGRE